MITAHSVHAASRGRGRRTKKQSFHWRSIKPRCGAQKKLTQRICPSGDTSAHKIRVTLLHLRGRFRGAREDLFPEAWRKPLDLRLNSLRHVDNTPARNMAIRPGRVATGRRPRRIKETRLCEQQIRPLGNLIPPAFALGADNLFHRPSDMYCPCLRALPRLPRYRAAQRPIHFEHAGTIHEFLKSTTIAGRKTLSSNFHQSARRHVAQNNFGRRQLFLRANAHSGNNLSAQRTQIGGHSVRDPLRATFRNRPPSSMRQRSHHKPYRRSSPRLERHQRMSRQSRKKRPSHLRFEIGFCQPSRRL